MVTRGFGYLPDPADARDKPVRALLGASPPPANGSVRHTSVAPKDQGGTNSCTGQAIAQGLRLSFLAAGVPCPELSALHPYYHGRAEWGAQRVDEGSYLRTGIKAVQHKGIPVEIAWPFDAELVNRRPSWLAEQRAWDRRGLRGYYRLFDPNDVRRAIAAGHAVVGGWDVDNAFLDYTGSGAIDSPRGQIVGAHAVAIEDFAPDGTFGLLNSWGLSWGHDGRARVTERWIAGGKDLWALVVRP